jgi:hypothetical protein
VQGAGEREDRHSLVESPLRPSHGIRQVLGRDGYARGVSERLERSQHCAHVLGIECEHEVQICGEAGVAVQHNGHAADDEVARLARSSAPKIVSSEPGTAAKVPGIAYPL